MARRWDSGFKTQHTINPENTSPQKYGVTDEEKAKWNSKQDALQYDEVPTEGSTKVMMSMHLKRAFENFKQEITHSYKRYFSTYSEELTAASDAINAAAQQAQDMTAQVINASEQAVSAANDAASSSSAAAYQAGLATDRVEIMQEYLQDANYAANRAHSEADRAVLMADRTAALAEEAERIAEQKAAETANATVKPLVTVAQSAATVASTYKQDAAEQAAYAKRQADQAKMYAENAAAIADVQIATDTRAGLIKGGNNHIAEDGELQLVRTTTDTALKHSHAGGIQLVDILGKSEQGSIAGNQLLDATAIGTFTVSGVTFNVLGDGGFYISGTKAADDWQMFARKTIALENGTYVLSHNGSYNNLARIRIKDSVGTSKDYGNGMSFKIDGTEQEILFMLQLDPKLTVNETIYPMLNAGTEALPWEPYCGGTPSPNPDYPQEIRSVKGKNLLDCRGLNKSTSGGGTITPMYDEHGNLLYIEANGTFTETQWYRIANINLPKGKYIASGCEGGSNSTYHLCFYNMPTTFLQVGAEKTFEFTEDANNKGIDLIVYGGTTLKNQRFYPMIRRASIADPTYVPYGCLRVKAHGKNFAKFTNEKNTNAKFFTFSSETAQSIVATKSGSGGKFLARFEAGLKAGTTYLITASGGLPIYCYSDELWGTNVYASQAPFHFTVGTDGVYVFGSYVDGSDGTVGSVTDFMVREASITDDTYEPYTESTMTLSKPVTLHGIGDVMDELTPDGVVRKFKGVVFDGSESGSDGNGWRYDSSEGKKYAYLKLDEAKYPSANIMCTAYKNNGTTNKVDKNIYVSTLGYLVICNTSFDDADANKAATNWKAHLSENPITVVYELATPITEPLPTADQIALRSLLSYDGVTYLEVDCDVVPTMKVKYGTSEVGALSIRNSNRIDVLTIGGGGYNLQEIADLVGGDA
jgi:hypothetical protein